MLYIKDVVTWLKNWFYDKTEVYAKSETYSQNELNSALGNKVNVAQGSANSDKNVVTNSSGNITTENKITAGSGLTLSNANQIAHSDTITALTTATLKKVEYNSTGHITGTGNVSTTDIPNSQAYDNIKAGESTTLTLTNQKLINDAINSKIADLTGINAIEVVTTKPTASADTMGKLYIVSENSKVNVYYTKRSGSSPNYTYEWQKMDADILDELSIDWTDVQNKPSTFTPEAHAHGNITNVGKIGSNNGGKPVILDSTSKVSAGEFGSTAGTFAEGNHTHSTYVTSIALVPKGSDPTADAYNGVIRLYYGDEPV